VPVVGGNVSLYNETAEGPIYPTPVVGMVGELPNPARCGGIAPVEGDAVALVGPLAPALAGSELAKLRGELGPGLPRSDLAAVGAALAAVREAVRAGEISAAHDVSDGGLACALAELAIAAGAGLSADLTELGEATMNGNGPDAEALLFGEGPGGILVCGERQRLDRLKESSGARVLFLGEVAGERIEIAAAGSIASVAVADAERAWRSLEDRVEGGAPVSS
jgi:phosphoribosylformylglycinamidine synthase